MRSLRSFRLDPARIDRFNPRWEPLPAVAYEAVPLANGWVGAAAWLDRARLRFDLSHQDFWDFREPVLRDATQFRFATFKRFATPYQPEKLREFFCTTDPLTSSRLPGIALVLEGPPLPKAHAVTLKLRQGIARWSGAVAFDTRVDASRPWLVLEGRGRPPRVHRGRGALRLSLRSAFDTPDSPVARKLRERGVTPHRVSPRRVLLVGRSRTLGVELVIRAGRGRWAAVACVACLPTRAAAERELDRQAAQVDVQTLRTLRTEHVREWRRLMGRSLVALPDERIEALYWLETYLLACMGRDGAPLMSIQGPWNFMDLVFIRWAMEVLNTHAGDDPEVREWAPLVERLAHPGRHPYVQFLAVPDEAVRPFKVRGDLALETSHRHHSHLVSIFPLQRHDPRDATEAALLQNNFRELMFRGHGEWVGFSFVWAAALAAHARMPNPGLSLLRDYAERYATRNGWMVQGAIQDLDFNAHGQNSWGVGVVTLEGPLAFPAAVLEMLLQDAHGRIEVFPAVPTVWPDAAFRDLLTCHGVRVSAERRQGRVRFVALEFVRDGACTLVNPWPESGCRAARARSVVVSEGRDVRVEGRAGDRWVFRPAGD